MTISERLPRALIAAVILGVLAIFALIQLASMSFVRAPGTLSAAIPRSFGLAVYRVLDRVAPAAYVEETLANDALDRGDLDAAQHYAVRIPPGPRRDDLLGRVAQARGQSTLALEYYFAAPDVDRMQAAIVELAKTDAPGAYAHAIQFAGRLAAMQRHPDAVAETYFLAGTIANMLGERARSLENYRRALALAPLDIKYVLNAGTEAYVSGDNASAKQYFARGVEIDPACGDCLAGLGLVALREHRIDAARRYEARARAADPKSAMLASLSAALK